MLEIVSPSIWAWWKPNAKSEESYVFIYVVVIRMELMWYVSFDFNMIFLLLTRFLTLNEETKLCLQCSKTLPQILKQYVKNLFAMLLQAQVEWSGSVWRYDYWSYIHLINGDMIGHMRMILKFQKDAFNSSSTRKILRRFVHV